MHFVYYVKCTQNRCILLGLDFSLVAYHFNKVSRESIADYLPAKEYQGNRIGLEDEAYFLLCLFKTPLHKINIVTNISILHYFIVSKYYLWLGHNRC